VQQEPEPALEQPALGALLERVTEAPEAERPQAMRALLERVEEMELDPDATVEQGVIDRIKNLPNEFGNLALGWLWSLKNGDVCTDFGGTFVGVCTASAECPADDKISALRCPFGSHCCADTYAPAYEEDAWGDMMKGTTGWVYAAHPGCGDWSKKCGRKAGEINSCSACPDHVKNPCLKQCMYGQGADPASRMR